MKAVLTELRRPWLWAWLLVAALLTLFAAYWSAYQGTGSGIPSGWAGGDVYTRFAAVKFVTVVAAVPLAVAIALIAAPARGARAGMWIVGLGIVLGAAVAVALVSIGSGLILFGIAAGTGRALLIGAMGVGALAAARAAGARTGAARAIGYIVAGASALIYGLHLLLVAITSLSPTL